MDANITEATSTLPTPASHTELHSYCGLVNQLTSGTYIIVEFMSPLRPLLSTKNEFIRSADHALFSKVKKQLIMSLVLTFLTSVNLHNCALMLSGKDWTLFYSSS